MSSYSAKIPRDLRRPVDSTSSEVEIARLRAELKRANFDKLKLAHELERVKSDRNLLERSQDELHRRLENECFSQAQMDGGLLAQVPPKPRAKNHATSIGQNHRRGYPLPISDDIHKDEMKPKKEVIDLLLSSDDEHDGSKLSSTKQPTNASVGRQKTFEDRPGLPRIDTNATLPESLSVHAKATNKDGNRYDNENEDVRRTAQKTSLHARFRNKVGTYERNQLSPVQLGLDMKGASPAQLNFPRPKYFCLANPPSSIVSSRITSTFKYSITRLDVDVEVLKSTFKRDDFAKYFGGCQRKCFPNVRKELIKQHGYERFMCIAPVYNPYIPQIPGAAGLYFALNDERYWPHERELVLVKQDGPDAVWNVMGDYEIKKSTPLTSQEFRMLPQEVQRGWLKSVKETNWGKPTCASIFRRSLESRDQKKSEMSDNEADFTPTEIQKNTTVEDIEKALLSGEERINVWTMRCVKYDEKFKRHIIEKQRASNQSVSASRRRDRRSVSSEIELVETQKLKRRRKNESDFSDSESSDFSDLEDDGDYIIARRRARKET